MTTNERGNFNEIFVRENGKYRGRHRFEKIEGKRHADQFSSIQAAVNDLNVQNNANSYEGEVYVPAHPDSHYTETINLGIQASTLRGQGVNTHIEGSGDHTLDVTMSDVTIQGLWADQIDSGSGTYDAINGYAEMRVLNCDIDAADRYGINANGPRCFIGAGTQIQGGDVAGLHSYSGGKGRFDVVIDGPAGDGAIIDDNLNQGNLRAWNGSSGTGRGLVVNGGYNQFKVDLWGWGSDALVIDGTDNEITGRVDGSVLFTSNSSNNVVDGVITGTVTNNGATSNTDYAGTSY